MRNPAWSHEHATENEQPLPGYGESQPGPSDAEGLKVSSKSQPSLVAGAIAGLIRSGKCVQLQAIGAGAVNQTVKAIATARNYLLADGIDIICTPAFAEVEIEGRQRTAIFVYVEPR